MNKLSHYDLTSMILNSCFEVMNELGAGFLEAVYRNALLISLREKGLDVEAEKVYQIYYKKEFVGVYKADIVVNNTVVIELKTCKALLPENQAQVINYLKASNLPIGMLVNFGNRTLEYKRLHNPSIYPSFETITA